MLKECKTHGLTEFASRQNGKRWRCRKCAVDSVQKRRDRLKQKSVEYKGGKCVKCGYDKCLAALDFHHLDPTEKEFGLGKDGQTRSWKRVQKELDKCILVCKNCHTEIHHGQ